MDSIEIRDARPLTKQLRAAARSGKGTFLLMTFKEVYDNITPGELRTLLVNVLQANSRLPNFIWWQLRDLEGGVEVLACSRVTCSNFGVPLICFSYLPRCFAFLPPRRRQRPARGIQRRLLLQRRCGASL